MHVLGAAAGSGDAAMAAGGRSNRGAEVPGGGIPRPPFIAPGMKFQERGKAQGEAPPLATPVRDI